MSDSIKISRVSWSDKTNFVDIPKWYIEVENLEKRVSKLEKKKRHGWKKRNGRR